MQQVSIGLQPDTLLGWRVLARGHCCACAVAEWEALRERDGSLPPESLPPGRGGTGFKQWNARQNVAKKLKKI